MDEFLNFGLKEKYHNDILVIGVGVKSLRTINYIENKESRNIDLLAFNKRINEELLVKYKLIFILADMSDLRSIYISSLLAAKIQGLTILTIGVITSSSPIERTKRNESLTEILSLKRAIDSLIIISNDHTEYLRNEASFLSKSDNTDYLSWLAIKTITDLARGPGFISTDFADVNEATSRKGFAIISSALASGNNRSNIAVKKALSSSNTIMNLRKAKNILLYISSSQVEATLAEISEVINHIHEKAICENILWNCSLDADTLESIRITIIGTGLEEPPILI